jgi:glucose-1-phosphate cytidylyltransferase
MKAVILAGGYGTRLSEETLLRPKPMVEIGGMPILWHIMKHYSHYGVNEFIICLGYKGYMIKEYFANYFLHNSDVTFDLAKNQTEIHGHQSENWRVTLIDTGVDTMTGGRIKRIAKYIGNETFCMTYGDGLSNVNITDLLKFHNAHGLKASVTAVRPPGRFGAMTMEADRVLRFEEKPAGDGSYINGGFFVLSPEVFNYIDGDQTVWEQQPMRRLVEEKSLAAYQHNDFWQPMDTLREKNHLEHLWATGEAPWRVWAQGR